MTVISQSSDSQLFHDFLAVELHNRILLFIFLRHSSINNTLMATDDIPHERPFRVV